jgi:hypothetical protein
MPVRGCVGVRRRRVLVYGDNADYAYAEKAEIEEGKEETMKIMKIIRSNLLKIPCINREAAAHKAERELQRALLRIEQKKLKHREEWAELMRSGNTVRSVETEKPREFDRMDCVRWGVE